jgi:hypothetical protein
VVGSRRLRSRLAAAPVLSRTLLSRSQEPYPRQPYSMQRVQQQQHTFIGATWPRNTAFTHSIARSWLTKVAEHTQLYSTAAPVSDASASCAEDACCKGDLTAENAADEDFGRTGVVLLLLPTGCAARAGGDSGEGGNAVVVDAAMPLARVGL